MVYKTTRMIANDKANKKLCVTRQDDKQTGDECNGRRTTRNISSSEAADSRFPHASLDMSLSATYKTRHFHNGIHIFSARIASILQARSKAGDAGCSDETTGMEIVCADMLFCAVLWGLIHPNGNFFSLGVFSQRTLINWTNAAGRITAS